MEGRTRIRWDRLGRWALIGVFALVLYLYIGPAVSWIETYREAGRQREAVAELRAENERLRERKQELSARGALEREARRLDEAYPEQQPTLERVTREIQSELRRRLGGVFTLDELAELYDEGTGWATDLAVETAPEEPFAWDARIVADAAFGRYMRAATDFAGGRRLG